ncbi:hypothetical protein QSJ19_14345 [Gordonia sp. ABSL11-1]|uniref:hypothetical protein n=1 Tax=Gordonia sp. ABSL11-1 TaxID=3053924 RepID=UPI0025738DB0|nr:hypothetical protein [Gordonia sp. ABSL11-1]MDL9946749.1 hypothetical protein [Gordonia sp. ABSL11-1]
MAETDDIDELYEAARKHILARMPESGIAAALKDYAEAYALLSSNPPHKGTGGKVY